MKPVEALRTWTLQFLDYMAAKDGMTDVLHSVLTADEGLRAQTRARINESLTLLIDAGKHSGDLRPDLDAADVSLALGGFALILHRQPSSPQLALRLLDLLLTGLAQP
jgi:hypothetical protein